MLKLKRFKDSEAKILGFILKYRNDNPIKTELPMIGSMLVQDIKTHIEFKLGSGFTDQQRKKFYKAKSSLRGMIVKYKYQGFGVKGKPRLPIFLGFRNESDL